MTEPTTDRASVSHITDDSEVGRCGHKAPHVFPDWDVPQTFCRLPAGHAGWHRGDDDSEWSPEPGASENSEGLAVGCTAATAGAPVSPEKSTDHADLSVSGITDDMVRKGAAAMWGSPERNAMKISRMVLSAALAGCTVVALPEPTANDEDDDPAWVIPGGGQIVACVIEGQPFVVSDPPSFRPLADRVEKFALRLLAAAREARRLAGSVSPKGDNTNG